MTAKELLDTYYLGLMKRSGWEPPIADDFIFLGGRNMTEPPIVGKAAYIQVMTDKFFPLVSAVHVKDQVVDGDRAYVLTNYDFSLPNGKKVNGDLVEAWTVRDGKLASRTVYHDSYSLDLLMKQ